MRSSVACLLAFATGAVIGAGATYVYTKNKYEAIIEEAINERDYYKYINSEVDEEPVEEKEPTDEEIKEKYLDKDKYPEIDPEDAEYIITEEEAEALFEDNIGRMPYYNKYQKDKEKKEVPVVDDGPYVIPPEEYGECGYATETLFYFADYNLTDEAENIIDDVENTVSYDALNRIGEYEKNCIHVRNDELEIDYEILVDSRKFKDVLKDRRLGW